MHPNLKGKKSNTITISINYKTLHNFLVKILLLVIIFSGTRPSQAQVVPTGAGSYNLSPPAGGATPQHADGTLGIPRVTSTFNKPIQTNDWWTSLLYKYYQNETFLWEIHSWKLYAHPLAFTANRYGLDIKYPDQVAVEDYFGLTDAKFQYSMTNQDFTVGVDGLDMGVTDTVKTADYGDWHVTAEWLDSDGKMLQATMAHGSPFTYFETNTDEVYLRMLFGHTIDHTIGTNIIGFTTQGHHYAVFAPSGTTWNTNGSYTFDENNFVSGSAAPRARTAFTCDLEGKHYFSIALLPDNSLATLQEFADHAFAFIEDTQVSWSYDASVATMNTTFTLVPDIKEGVATQTIQALYPHQWKHSQDINTAYTYQSPRGNMKVIKGNTFTTQLSNNGVLPVLPVAISEEEKNTLYQFIVDEFQVSNTYVTLNDTYWQGKRFGRQADLIYIADQVGHTEARDKFISDLKTELEDWMTAPNGETDRGYFYYDPTWQTLIGYPASFGSDVRITDHHFHYGYFIKAAATIARFDPNWINDGQWGSMVKLIIKDVNNWDKTDTQFPFLRCFDAYAGHSWASGHGNFHFGNDQEASSESINFAAWVYALGLHTADDELRDFGLFLYLNEAEAAQQYWFNKDQESLPDDYAYQTITRIWGNGGDKILGNSFEAESEYQLGINTFPIQAPLLYLGKDSTTIANAYEEASMLGDGVGDLWEDIMWGYLAMARPEEALADYQDHTTDGYYNTNAPWLPNTTGIYHDFSDASLAPAQIFHWLHALDSLGIVAPITADYPAAMVFKKGETKHYIIDNVTDSDLMVQFSDGEQVLAPASTLFTKTIDANCSSAIIQLDNEQVVGTYIGKEISTNGTVEVVANTTFKAQESISLNAGFQVISGTDFLAFIENCNVLLDQASTRTSFNKSRNIPTEQLGIKENSLQLNISPNPLNQRGNIQYVLSEEGSTKLFISNILGEVVQLIYAGTYQKEGTYQIEFDATKLSRGTYFLVLQSGTLEEVQKVVIVE